MPSRTPQPTAEQDRRTLTPITYEEYFELSFGERLERRYAAGRTRVRWQGSAAYKRLRVQLRTGRVPCELCGARELIQIDHIRAIILGGTHDPENLRPLCRHCHMTKKGF